MIKIEIITTSLLETLNELSALSFLSIKSLSNMRI